jgi:hypothetical protein
MAGLNEDGQWIILLALIISVSIFFLALIVNESVLVGQTTAESVIDFPKSDIQDFRHEVMRNSLLNRTDAGIDKTRTDINLIGMVRKNSIITISGNTVVGQNISLHFNNGVTAYNETVFY